MNQNRPVLVVDDDADIREAMHDLLEDEGYESVAACDGGEALTYLSSHPPPSLILLDWNMAPMNGQQFMEEFTKHPMAREVPVVLVTADARAHETPWSSRFAGHLKKPVSLEGLFALINKFCGRK